MEHQIKTAINDAIIWHENLKISLNNIDFNLDLDNQFPSIFNEFVKIFQNLDNLTNNLKQEKRKELKNYIQNSSLVKLTSEGALFRQIISKPNGYAGDAQVMRYMYQNRFEGESNFEKIMHKIAASVITAETVRKRKSFIKEIFESKLEKDSNVLSIAAGPALEIKEFLEGNDNAVHFDAIDHDIDTLKDSLKNYKDDRLKYKLANAFNILKGDKTVVVPRVKLIKYASKADKNSFIKKLVLYKRTQINQEYDLVYSLGLYDYIKTFKNKNRGSIGLTTALFKFVNPGGFLIIGNFSTNGPSWIRWHMNYVCNWELIYRDDSEINKFISGIDPDQIESVNICEEKTGINKFIIIQKTNE